MRKRRGSSIVEVVMGAGLMMLITLGTMSLLVSGLRYATRTTSDLTMSTKNAQALRWISELSRGAMTATITNAGSQINFALPKDSAVTDAYTGEKEVAYPLASDGVNRGFKVDFAAGTLTDLRTNRILVKNIASTDPDPSSTTYNQTYAPFQFSMVGARKVIVIQLIIKERVAGTTRYARMKNTVLLRNT
jgi:hypothetical protein